MGQNLRQLAVTVLISVLAGGPVAGNEPVSSATVDAATAVSALSATVEAATAVSVLTDAVEAVTAVHTLTATPAEPGREALPRIRVSGVRVSASARVAIVNDRIVHEGDTIDGARIVAIDSKTVRFEIGARALTARVGLKSLIEEPAAPAAPATPAARYGPVRRGETLSAIAHAHLGAGITASQMTIALYEANPEGFGGNINLLHEGALLRIPALAEITRSTPAAAAAEVAKQHDTWAARRGALAQARDPTPTPLAAGSARPDNAAAADTGTDRIAVRTHYGPVGYGETLSLIAARITIDGATQSQIMMALFRANPAAFRGNINRLLAGAVLEIPEPVDLRSQPPEPAAAEVVRQRA